jgi:putative ABC transport system ATP-binding protein
LLLADEPTGNLDSGMSADVLAMLRRFNRDRGQTLVLVTHDAEVGAVCDRIIHMRDGLCERSESLVVSEHPSDEAAANAESAQAAT